MAYTITTGAGSNVAAGADITPAYPASGMGAGKLALLYVFYKSDVSATLTTPSGWTLRGSVVLSNGNTSALYSRELDGTETPGGTITLTSAGPTNRRAAWINVVDTSGGTGWNFEDIDVETSTTSTTINDNNVTTGGSNRLAMNFIGYTARQTGGQENFVSETGGSWVATAFFESGNNPTLSLQTAELASAGTIGGGTDASITSSAWIIHGLSIWRNATASADLTVSDITWNSTAPAVGKPLLFSAVVDNIGAGASPAGIVHGVKFDVNGADVAFATSWTASILPSSSVTIVADGSWSPVVSASSAVITAMVDYSSFINESTNLNNSRSETITIVDLPNLQVTDISWVPASPVVGDAVVFSAAVKNAGLAPTSSGIVHGVNFEVSGSLVASNNTYVTAIASSSTATIAADGSWVPTSAGTFSVVATVDPSNLIVESNEGDNQFSENVTIAIASSAIVTKFAGRGPGSDGNITPILSDYDAFFLTQGEGDDRYLQTANIATALSTFLTEAEASALYLTSSGAEALFLTQTEADAQGMPAIEAGSTSSTLEVREVNANFTLLAPSSPRYYWQSYFNIGAAAVTVSPPSGNTIVGSQTINAGESALFIKRSGAAQFRRWS